MNIVTQQPKGKPMLVDPIIKNDNFLKSMNTLMGQGTHKRIQKGIYNWWDFSNFLEIDFDHQCPILPIDIPCYGVCDSIEQFLQRYQELLENSEKNYAISFSHIAKKPENKGNGGGWRWHKWGGYIGDGTPEHEYLDDEEGFNDGVCIYHVYQIPDDQINKRTTQVINV